ncbi:MAG TPA: alkaline phosphatase family protein, partial [Mycobacterium sp.]
IHAVNLLDRLEAARKSWRAYMESMPWPCDSASAGRYEVGHNPFVYYDDIRNNPLRCDQNVVPLQQLGADLQSAATTPDFVWITPNLCHDMHDCSVQKGDAWLAQFLPQILQSAAFRQQDSLLVLTWDEGNFTHANQVATILVAPRHIQPGTRFAARSNDYSLLRTIESFWGLKPLQPNDAGAKPIVNLLRPR